MKETGNLASRKGNAQQYSMGSEASKKQVKVLYRISHEVDLGILEEQLHVTNPLKVHASFERVLVAIIGSVIDLDRVRLELKCRMESRWRDIYSWSLQERCQGL